jgi:hypothetical protein
MNERNLNKGQWEDRKRWSLGVEQRRKSFETNIYIYIYIFIYLFIYLFIYIKMNVCLFVCIELIQIHISEPI